MAILYLYLLKYNIMKKIYLLLTFVSCLVSSQIRLEATLPKEVSYYTDESGTFYLAKGSGYDLRLWKGTVPYSSYKTISLDLPSGSYFQILNKNKFNLTKYVFNQDDKLEIIGFIRTNLVANPARLVIFNEDGELLRDFGPGYVTLDNYSLELDDIIDIYVEKSKNRLKMKVRKGGQTEIYDLGPNTLGIQEVNEVSKTTAFPVPTSSILNITDPKNGFSIIEVFDISGRKVLTNALSSTNGMTQIDVSSLPKGTYVYKIGNSSSKFIKN